MTATRKRQRPASAPKPREPAEGGYRCAECGHGEKLWAYAGANVYGPLAADGASLDEHEAVEEWGIYEDSIQCAEHPGAMLECFVGGQWCRWWRCPGCKGAGQIIYSVSLRDYSHECRGETPLRGAHEGWIPVEEYPRCP